MLAIAAEGLGHAFCGLNLGTGEKREVIIIFLAL